MRKLRIRITINGIPIETEIMLGDGWTYSRNFSGRELFEANGFQYLTEADAIRVDVKDVTEA
jgi:hypothetical protein